MEGNTGANKREKSGEKRSETTWIIDRSAPYIRPTCYPAVPVG